MNFFGHAAVACWLDTDARWVLGAMLPDFAGMSRARLQGARDPRVSAGIAFHHRTDDAFHGAPIFTSLCAHGARELERAGVARGPARAVAHVGAEMLIDGLLLDRDPAVREAYLNAVDLGPRASVGLRFRGDGADRFAELSRRLASAGLPVDYRRPEGVARRLTQTLARRPRLALTEDDLPAVVPWLRRTQRQLEPALDGLLSEVRAGLRRRDEPQTEVSACS